VIPTEQKEVFAERIEELNQTEIEVKLGLIKISDLVRSEEMRPGYKTDAIWFYQAPEMFAFPEASCEGQND